MTGFGKSSVDLPHKTITFQLKSVNSKKFNLYTKLPTAYEEKEMDFRKIISNALKRGKVDLTVNAEYSGDQAAAQLNHEVIHEYIRNLQGVSQTDMHDDLELLKIALTLPDVLKTNDEVIDEKEFDAVKDGLQGAVDRLNTYRSDEGQTLQDDFELRVKNLTELLKKVEEMDHERIGDTKKRLNEAISNLKEEVDENRFEQELVYYIEKYDITEEKTRLENHLSYFSETLTSEESNGKKLNFISQEIGREVNTIGSKSNYAPMQKLVVQMKDELEKIKEQLLNVL